ncbi:hypothetical protein IFM89_012122 [Coptis chinensis]|uniref:KH type-2 domain-containing protein n=1 Tax=Coptis chinensis TaxID=261450 RepID=A0A835I1N1_9MAGN|nr:hypothetical protein IFM89_012122 [Coptis chinensis]
MVTPMRNEIIIHSIRTQNVLGEKGRRIRELTSIVQKRFKFPKNNVEKVNNRGGVFALLLKLSLFDISFSVASLFAGIISFLSLEINIDFMSVI